MPRLAALLPAMVARELSIETLKSVHACKSAPTREKELEHMQAQVKRSLNA